MSEQTAEYGPAEESTRQWDDSLSSQTRNCIYKHTQWLSSTIVWLYSKCYAIPFEYNLLFKYWQMVIWFEGLMQTILLVLANIFLRTEDPSVLKGELFLVWKLLETVLARVDRICCFPKASLWPSAFHITQSEETFDVHEDTEMAHHDLPRSDHVLTSQRSEVTSYSHKWQLLTHVTDHVNPRCREAGILCSSASMLWILSRNVYKHTTRQETAANRNTPHLYSHAGCKQTPSSAIYFKALEFIAELGWSLVSWREYLDSF